MEKPKIKFEQSINFICEINKPKKKLKNVIIKDVLKKKYVNNVSPFWRKRNNLQKVKV